MASGGFGHEIERKCFREKAVKITRPHDRARKFCELAHIVHPGVVPLEGIVVVYAITQKFGDFALKSKLFDITIVDARIGFHVTDSFYPRFGERAQRVWILLRKSIVG